MRERDTEQLLQVVTEQNVNHGQWLNFKSVFTLWSNSLCIAQHNNFSIRNAR